ncbi:hypothetical protein VB834_07415 [Limnoraphis robusta Tam1]|uniref:hypothetical protein n=1 Tax=Limnoraphis robusta TaxID=1118279 RepID=UPI002B200FF6|nr:hypothetical protein [Limnoraphis robusta]MEA5538857.1 hypothetical protein [Limnoraphis robusta Tam1]
MSSPASGPFKSRLLNLIVENYQQFLDSCGLTWRQVQFSTSTTVQTVMYSVYSLLESLVKGKKRLGSTQQPQSPQLKEAQASQKQLDGVDQPIIDIVTIAIAMVKGSPRLKVDPNSVQAIACQVKTKKLVLVGAEQQILDVLSWRERVKLSQLISREVADLSSLRKREKSPQSSQLQTLLSGAMTTAQKYTTAITRQTEELGITLAQAWKTSASDLTVYTPENHSMQTSVTANFHQVQAVIWAAIDYFFFKDHNQQLNLPSPPENLIAGKPQPQKFIPPTGKIQPLTTSQTVVKIGQRKSQNFSEKGLTTSPAYGLIMSDACKYLDTSSKSDRQEESNCVQTEARAVGYVKHPLEKVLEWVDRVIFWVEEAVIKAWEWVKQKWTAR